MAYKGTTQKNRRNYPPDGWVPVYRDIISLLDDGILKTNEFGYYMTYLVLATWVGHPDDWNHRHIRSDSKMELLTSIDRSTWCRQRNYFISAGLFGECECGKTEILYFREHGISGGSQHYDAGLQ